MKTSALFRLNWQDVLKALLMAVLSPIIPIIENSIAANSLTFNWHNIAVAAVGGGVAYLIKNFLTPAATVTKLNT